MEHGRDSSLLFSLQALLTEQERREQEQRLEQQRQVEAERRRAEEAERIRQKTEQLRLQQEQQRRRLEEQRQREEAARLQGLREAELERARAEVEARARLELAERQAEHGRRLQALAHEATRPIDRWIGILGVSAGVLSMAAAALLYVFQLVPERQRLEAEHEGLLRAERDRAERAEQIAARERSQQEKLALELKQSRNELGETQRQLTHELQRKTPTAVRVRSGPPKQEPDCKTSGQKYDPLNPCLPR